MASKLQSNRLRKMESKKSHSWWWDSHISPKNSKWLQENLQEMDQLVSRMLKLIEEDAESFAKKAELYFRKRPELINLVEEFYRMYRSLAERYDIVSGELKKAIPPDLQSQGSGISDMGSEQSLPSPNGKPNRAKSGARAAGFDVFLGGGGSASDLNSKGDDSSTSQSDSDDSSVNNYNAVKNIDVEQELRRKNLDLEAELREVKEKLEISKGFKESHDVILAKIASYEEELRFAKERLQQSQTEITVLVTELQMYKSLEGSDSLVSSPMGSSRARNLDESTCCSGADASESMSRIHMLEEELDSTKEKLCESANEIERLRQEDELKSTQTEVSNLLNKLEEEKEKVSKLEEENLNYKASILGYDQEIHGLKESFSSESTKLSEENMQLQDRITEISMIRTSLEDDLKNLSLHCQSLEQDSKVAKDGKYQLEITLRDRVDELMKEQNEKMDALMTEKDNEIEQKSKHLHQLHMQHVKLIGGYNEARKLVDEMGSRIQELEKQVEREQEMILEREEEKREAIRQLCLSIDYYRSCYHRLRSVITRQKRSPVMVSS